MRRGLLALLAVGALAVGGCGAFKALSPVQERAEVCVSVEQARAALADLKAIYQRVAPVALGRLAALPPDQRRAVIDADQALRRLYFEAERAGATPGVAVNWQRVAQYLSVLIGAAL